MNVIALLSESRLAALRIFRLLGRDSPASKGTRVSPESVDPLTAISRPNFGLTSLRHPSADRTPMHHQSCPDGAWVICDSSAIFSVSDKTITRLLERTAVKRICPLANVPLC